MKTLLVIADHATLRGNLALLLELEGFRVGRHPTDCSDSISHAPSAPTSSSATA